MFGMSGLSDAQWETILDEADPQTYGEVLETLRERDEFFDGDARDVLDAALDDVLVETDDWTIGFADEDDVGEDGPEGDDEVCIASSSSSTESDARSWADADFATPESGRWATDHVERGQWMGHKAGDKQPFAPWADADAPVSCDHHEEPTTCAECGHSARYKWGYEGNYTDHDEALLWADRDPRLAGLAFIQRADDPLAFVDGDDVRDPETGGIHPVFETFLEHLGVTYGDISVSGAGVHAVYLGALPEGVKEAKWEIDDEPWGANDELPAIEIYDGKHVCVATGEHIPGTPESATEWDDDALEAILRANDQLNTRDASADDYSDFDIEDYDAGATSSDETANDVRDIYAALDRLNAQEVAERTIVDEWIDPSHADYRAFVPTWANPGYEGTANFVTADVWKDSGTRGGKGGPACMAAIDAGLVSDRDCPSRVNGGTWWEAVDHLRDLGFPIPEYQPENDEDDADDPRDLLGLDVVVEPANALAAASAVTPEDLTDPDALPELARDDVDDVAIAVALQEGWITTPDQFPADGRYTEAYYLARDRYGAPLPKYLDNTTLEERADLAMAAVDRITPEHILDTCESTVTVDDPSGTATAKLDPTWEDSESGERIIAGYGRGFWCAKHSPGQPEGNRTFDALQLVALEHDLVENEFVRPRGEAYKQAYRLLREEYGAPLPKWRATILEHRAVLPPAVRLLDDDHRATPAESLADARAETEALVRDAVTVRDRAQLLTVVPGGGKTYSAAVVADEKPILYVASRNELKDQMEAYVHEIHADDDTHPDAEPTCMHLPILAENQLGDAAIEAGVGAVREHGRDLLRDRDALLEHVTEYIEDAEDAEETDADSEDIDLDRSTCATAEGDYSLAWRVAVQVARALGHRPADLHTNAEALFGEELPCRHEIGECEYTAAWEAARDPDNPKDVLIGSPGHAFVDSATTYFERRGNERVERPRAVVVDEFPGETFATDYGDRFMDHAVWLADALRGVQTREDLGAADLADDTWINAWLNGEGADYAPAADAKEVFTALASIADATTEAHALLDGQLLADVDADTNVDIERLRGLLQDLVDATPGGDVLHDVQDGVRDILDDVEGRAHHRYTNGRGAGALYALRDRLEDILGSLAEGHAGFDDRDPLAAASAAVDDLPASGDLEHLLRNAIDAVGTRAAKPLLEAALTALDGGRDGCRALAIHATDGYAHPTAWALLAGAIADTEHGNATDVALDTFSLDEERDGGHFKRLTKNDATIAVDKNHHGAIVVDTPAFTDITGAKCAVLGLDATGRTDLWRLAIGRDTQRRDIHDTDAERRRFLRETMNLTVVQTTDRPLPYHGKPDGKNFQEDLELIRTVANEYTGTHPEAFDDKGPAVISTLKVLNHLEDDLADHAGDTVNYENMKGSDALGDHQVAVILGSQHYGDAAPEKWALLAGQDAGRGDTRGPTLDYGSDIANAYLHHMREDHTMQAILRAGRNADASVVFAHTSALRDDLPVDDQGAVVSAHSRGTLAVVDAARDLRGRTFTARDIATAIDDVGLRQVQNVLADLRDGGYLRVDTQGSRGRAYEYELGDADPGLADVDLPELEDATGSGENEISGSSTEYTWNFVFEGGDQPDAGVTPPSRATIPVSDTVDAAAPPT
ncbi:hypothetical protein GCM10009017_13090 [Halarchaeum rubridurum]|uniref:Uncharacterized protein n=2 Tax=Halarchaeum rubridurum TaxID=489911 RepID=A0A830FV84_9EURY|nr:hypothetical protein GCM10009017_13090 [Halarchaeum rubridurum]